MKSRFYIIAALGLLAGCTAGQESMKEVVEKGLSRAGEQSLELAGKLSGRPGLLPRSTDPEGNLTTSDSRWWTSGFFAGSLWYMYENTGDELFRTYAEEYTRRVESEQYTTDNHDVGFMLYCSFGNGLRLTGDESYKPVLLQGAESLCTRYHEGAGLIRSWDEHSDKWEYPVIIDNMMNLEMLIWAAKNSNDPEFMDIALRHADKTMANHYRNDYSCYHVVGYDPRTGEAVQKHTNQGHAHESSWARGQAWGLYGFTMMYRETEDLRYLLFAQKIAAYLLSHPNLPGDKIPYWDFDAPDIPDAPRDASAAAIMASALLELGTLTNEEELSLNCFATAETILRTLTSDRYLAAVGTNAGFVLKHSVGNMPLGLEIDVPLVYTDYYYIEALTRYKRMFLS